MFEQVKLPKKLKQRLGKAISIVMSAAMLVTALPADMLGGIMSVKAAADTNAMVLDITELAKDSTNPLGLASSTNSDGKTVTTASYTASKVLGDFTVTAATGKNVDVDESAKSYADDSAEFTFTHRLKLGGEGSPSARSICFATDGSATVIAYAVSSSSSAARTFKLYKKDDSEAGGTEVGSYDGTNIPAGTAVLKLTMPKIEDAGEYYLASTSGGVNVYRVEVIPDAVEGYYGDGQDGDLVLKADDLISYISADATTYDFKGGETKLGASVFSVVTGSDAVTIEKAAGENGPWKTADESETFNARLKLNGGGAALSADGNTAAKRAIKFTPTKNGRFIVYAISGKSDADRTLVLENPADSTDAGKVEISAPGANIKISEVEVKAGVTYYLYSKSSGINLFYLELNYSPKPPEPVVRGPWADVPTPEITDVALNESNASKINVTVEAFIESDGGDKVELDMIDAKGDVVATQSSEGKSKKNAEGEYDNAHVIEFTPAVSGEYTFIARLIREDEEPKLSKESKSIKFNLPLTTPIIKGVTNKGTGADGKGRIEIAWQKVTEANSYEVTVTTTKTAAGAESNARQTVNTIALSTVVEGLEVGSEVEVSLVAVRARDEAKSTAAVQKATVSGETERTWSFTAYGSSTSVDSTNMSASKNGYEKKGEDSVQVWSEGNAGKIVPASTDGLAYYYTTIDPETENFTLTADVKVDKWTYSNGQDGFGLMVSDTIGETGDTGAVWNNSYQLLSTKIEYRWDPEANDGKGAVTTKDVVEPVRRYSMRQGLGWIAKTGATALDIANINAGTATAPASFKSTSGTLETTAGLKYLTGGNYNMVGNLINPDDSIPTYGTKLLPDMQSLTEFKLQIQRNNTGYILRYLSSTEKDVDGKPVVLSEQTFYDPDRNTLTQIDKKNIYVGFIAARNARMTVSNITLTTIDPDDDEKAADREITTVISNYTISSPEYSNSSYYELIFSGNQDGNLTILGEDDKVIAMNAEIKAGSKYTVGTNLKLGKNQFDFTFVPNPDYTPGEYQQMDNHDTWTQSFTVTYQELTGDTIYVSPAGKSDNAGTAESPLDIYTAVNYAHAGQTIYLAGGKYMMVDIAKAVGAAEDALVIGKGHDGTEKAPIVMKAAADATGANRPVLDFAGQIANKSAFIMAGDYWHLKGFDVTNSAATQKGIQVSGDYNLLEDMRTYLNGNTGVQIARYGSDSRIDWPSYNTVLNCTSYMNADPGYEDADGFAAKLTIGDGNRFVGCISAYNADDGWDLFAKVETGSIGAVTIENCLAFKNGYVLGTREEIDGKKVDTLSL
ncbi:MAG: hypothetical protein NC548_46650, partial [Lachnospiraceae bacterium]|nr:hypothetical protein [Lachnospiraceae bacterium]